jgi:small subunit ribosomal protein S7
MAKLFFNKEQVHHIILYCLKLLIKNGNKTKIFVLFSNFFSSLKKHTLENPSIVFLKIIRNIEPFCEVKNLKIRGVARKVPVSIHAKRQKFLAIKCLISNSKKRKEKTLIKKLTLEFIDALGFAGKSAKSCTALHKTAELNKIFVQYKN